MIIVFILVRAYLFGYLSNLRTTADENKQDQKRFYEGILIKSSKKPLNDILRYSQNLEYYQQYPLLHSGFLLNGEVIYSYNSFLARSSSASLKAFIFGREYNMFKINFRIENLEPLLEKLFGPKGHFAKNKGSTFDNVKNYVTQAINYAKNRKQNGVDSESYSEQTCENIPEEEMKKMYIDVALTLLGNDLGWFTFQELECKITYQHIIDALLKHFDNSVTDEKNIELSIRKQLSIIDSETKYVTCSGLPFALKIHATAAIKFDIATKIDLESYFEHPENSNFTLKLVPSGSLDFNSKLIIDGHILETGYKITSSLHTSTGFDFSFETDVDKGFKFVYGLPLSVMDILTIKSEAYSIVQERGSQPIEIPLLSTDIETKSYKRTFDKFEEIIGLSFFVHYESPWNGKLKSLLPFFGRSLFSLKIIKVDTDLTKYVSIGNYDFKTQTLKYIKCIFVTPDASTKRGLELLFIYDTNEHNTFVAELKTPFTKIILLGTLVNSDEQKTIEVKYIDGPQHILSIGVKCEQVDSETIKYSPIFEAKYSTEVSDETYKHYLLSLFDIEGYVLVQCNMNPESHYPTKLTLNDIAVVTAKSRHSLQGSFTFNNNEVLGDVSLTANSLAIKMNGLLSGNYPIFKLDLNLNMIRNEQPDQQLETDESYNYYRPNSKFVALLYKVKTLNLLTSQEIHIESPYVYLSHFHIHLDDDYLKANYDILIENNEPTILVNISASNFLDEAFNVNITVLPRTVDTGLFVHGLLENSLVSDPSNSGYRDFKYVQNKNKKSSHLEFTSEYPQKFGKYQISAERQSTVDSFKYTLLYDIQNGSAFTVDIDILTNDIICNINFDSPNPEDKSYMLVHGWLKTKNTYGFDTKALWAGEQNLNYMNANGQMLLNGRQIHISGFVDYPLANLVNVHLSVKSNPDPENEDGGFATVQCTSNNQVLLSEKFKYKLILNDDEFYVSGKSIYEESQNFKPVSFEIIYKNYIDDLHFTGKQIEYKIELEQNNQQILHQKRLEVTKHVLNYRQIYKIDDKEQNIMMDLSYNITSASDWSYKLISKVNSPSIFDYLTNNDENVLEFNSYFTFGNYSLDQKHTLKMYSSQMLIDLYKFKWCTNYEKTTFKLLYNKREIRGLAHYSLDKIEGGYDMKYASRLWLNFKKEPNSESTLSINNYYTIQDGLSAGSFIKICVPLFNNKEMGIITDVQMFKSWKNPLYILLELDIFPSTEQTLKLSTSLNRDIQDNGVLYSTSLMAESKGMKLDYEINYAFYISSDKWGEYLDIRFIDSDNSVKPIQLHFELVPKGFTQKINIFDIAVVYVDSTIMVKDGVLNTRSNIRYNKRPYSFELSVNLNPSFKFIMEWEDQKGYREKLILEGSITMDESAVISATRIQNNGKDVKYVGYLTKFLDEKHWWETNNHLSSEQSNEIWKSLMGQFIELFISVNSNITTIVDVAKQQRRVRWHEAKKAQPLQYHALVNYTCNEAEQIFKEVWEDTYILQLPMLILNTTEVVFADVIKCIDHNSHYFVNSIRHLKEKMRIYLKNTYKYYSYQADILRNKLMHDIDELMDQVEFTLLDILRQLNLYTDEPVNDMQSSEPRSVKEYYDNFMNTLMKAFDEFEEVINNIKDLTENYIKSLSIYDLLHDQIENLKSYPLKENLSIKIHNYLKELEMSAPTKDFASFVNALNKYINNVMHDIPVSQREIIALRNKGFILVKSMMFNFSNYVNYDRAMAIYNALRKLFNIVQTVLYIASPNTFQYPTDENLLLSELNEYNMQFYQKYVNPLNFIPPFNAQGVIISSTYIITYNNQVYSFMPYNGCYILVEDFVNNKFSILAYYNNNVLTKLSVSTNNGEKYVIFSGGSVTVNGRNIDFPHITDNLKIWKDVYYLEIEIAVGVSIKCTLDFNIIQMFVNGYHYSYVFGLLGSMYQEPTFDFKLSNGELSEDMVSFLLAYRKMGNDEPTITDLLQTDQPLCSNLFSGNSTLRPFFKNISPIAYRTICNQIVSLTTSEQDSLDKACLVTKAFVSMIRQNFMLSCNIPDMCITTSVHERTIDATTNVKISEPNNVADVMILFEKTVKIQKVFLKILNPFIKQVTSNFNKKGINDVKFILMGYSEKSDSEVYMYTINEGEDITKILSNMPELTESQIATTDDDAGTSRLQSQFIHSFKTVIGQNSKDKAHRLSVDYPYRMNANIVVLSITQSLYDIHSSIIGLSKYTFDYILSWYIKQSISFFLIGPINLKDASDNDIFGANGANTIYSISSPNGKNHGNKYSYNASLETNLVFMEKGGIYDLQFLSQATSSQEKIFLDSLCKTIVGTSVSDSIVEKSCSSSLYKGVMPYPKCVVITA